MGAEEPRTNLGGAVPFCILGPTQSLKSVAHPGPAPPCPAYLSRSLPQLPPAAGVCGIRTPCKVTSASATPVMRTVTMQQRLSALPSCPRHRGDAWPPYSRPSFPESRELFSLLSHSLRNVTGNIQLCRLWATTAPQVRMGSGPSPQERQAPTEVQEAAFQVEDASRGGRALTRNFRDQAGASQSPSAAPPCAVTARSGGSAGTLCPSAGGLSAGTMDRGCSFSTSCSKLGGGKQPVKQGISRVCRTSDGCRSTERKGASKALKHWGLGREGGQC